MSKRDDFFYKDLSTRISNTYCYVGTGTVLVVADISIKYIELINLIYYEFIVVIIPSRNVVTSHLPSPAWWKPPNGQSIHSQSVPDNSHQNVLHKMAPIPIWQLDKWIEFDNLWKWLNTFFQFYYRFLVLKSFFKEWYIQCHRNGAI